MVYGNMTQNYFNMKNKNEVIISGLILLFASYLIVGIIYHVTKYISFDGMFVVIVCLGLLMVIFNIFMHFWRGK